METEIDESTRAFVSSHRVARLATADGDGRPSVVPICYAFDGRHLYSPLDEKPKSVATERLKRVRNISINPRVSVVIDDYSDDWSKLAYVQISGSASIIDPADHAEEHAGAVRLLRDKYPQYRAMEIDKRPVIRITPISVKHWRADGADEQ
ncbi:MAG TPA: TIGR03668 family PPOX class F420-dependent oxidoreductase [Blastocatellia bacterium]|nr:TIGR03668 family PPOX class F420-dependent oxidoreductase [Blastocatellia bacterium]